MWLLILLEAGMLSICTIDDLYFHKVNIIPIFIFSILGILASEQVYLLGTFPGVLLILISLLYKKSGIGLGDGIVIMCLGLLVGLNGILFTTFLALAMSCFYGIASLLLKKKNLKSTYPFVPFISLGYMIFMYKKMYEDGSLTVEMSLLIPGIFAVILFIIFTSYYIHDKCIIKHAAYKACMEISSYDHGDSVINDVESNFDEIISGRTLGKWELNRSAELENEKIVLSISGRMSFPGIFSEYLSGVLYTTNQVSYTYLINEAEYINEHRN